MIWKCLLLSSHSTKSTSKSSIQSTIPPLGYLQACTFLLGVARNQGLFFITFQPPDSKNNFTSKKMNYLICLSILVSLIISGLTLRLIYSKVYSNTSWTCHYQLKLATYLITLLYSFNTCFMAQVGADNSSFHLYLISTIIGIIIFYMYCNTTLYACVLRYSQIALAQNSYQKVFKTFVPLFYLLMTVFRCIYAAWYIFGENQACRHSNTEFCSKFAVPISYAMVFIISLTFPILELILCVHLIQITLIKRKEIQVQILQSYNRQAMILYCWIAVIITIDIVTVMLCLSGDFEFEIIGQNLSVLHVFASFAFLGQLKISIDMAEESKILKETMMKDTWKETTVNESIP